MPLFEVVGVTSTGLTFSVAFMLLASERHHNFVWALEKLKGLGFTCGSKQLFPGAPQIYK